jgi:dTDP-4-amino-4,6-dideoxygalactose transaminase
MASPDGAEPAYHLYYVILDESEHRDAALRALHAVGVKASFHYVPLHLTPGGRRWGEPADCPVTVRIASSIIRLPLHQSMSVQDAERNAGTFLEVLETL